MSDIKDQILAKIAEVAGPKIADITWEALMGLADEEDNIATKIVLTIAAEWTLQHGAESVEAMMDKLVEALDKGDLGGMSNLPDLDALTLAQLTEVYQQAEADDLKEAKEWAKKLGKILRQIGESLGKIALGAL